MVPNPRISDCQSSKMLCPRAGPLTTTKKRMGLDGLVHIRDLVRAREDAVEDRMRARNRISKFLLRHNRHPKTRLRAWGSMHRRWLDSLQWTDRREQVVFQEYLHHLDEIEGRLKRLDAAIHLEATESERAPVIRALQTLRGVAEVTATSLVAEIGEFRRFRNPKQLMAYAGLVPREYSSGSSRWQGSITKAGNSHLRRVLGEAAWSYRYKPALKRAIKKRQEGQSPRIQDIAWRAQDRLHRKYMRMVSRGKNHNVAVTSVARELLGFIWAIGCEAERQMETSPHLYNPVRK